MATKADCWKALDGSLHATEKAADEHDLSNLRTKLIASMAKSEELEGRLIEHADEVIRVLTSYVKSHPRAKQIKEEAPSEAEKGPARKDPPQPADETHGDMA